MRPHRLEMTAFGPFAGTVEVDLDHLAQSGLFLLHGETGAGKSTLLDGLGFALYGSVPGVRQRGGRLRSDHADPALRTEVRLEVTLGGRRWRITRSPAQERPKQRGTGTTPEQARVLLEVLAASGWETVSTRLDEAARELDGLLGMSADQFFQVVLLPQGEFARFLRGRSEERADLLRRLFATERFKDVEDWLAGRRVATASAVSAGRQTLQVLRGRLAQAAGAELPDEPEPAWPGELLRRAAADAASLAAAAQQATAARDEARRRAESAARLAERQERRRAALQARAELAAADGPQELLDAELRDAARAAELAAVLEQAQAREGARGSAAAAERAARQRLADAGLAADLAVPALRATVDAAREQAGRLDALRGRAQELDAERQAEAAAGRDVAAGTAALAGHEAALDRLPARRERALADVEQATAAAARLPERRAALAGLERALADAAGLAQAAARARDLHEEHLLARETWVSLREKAAELREARLTSMVAELADTLVPGAPCEVCGSTVHPDPYEGGGDGVTRDDEERARQAADDAGRRVAELEAALAAAAATAEGHRARLAETGHLADGEVPPDLRARRDTAQDEVAADTALAARLPQARAQAQQVEAEQLALDGAVAQARADAALAAQRRDAARRRAEQLAQELAAQLGGSPDLHTALAGVERTRAVAEAVLHAAEQAARAADEAALATAAADAAAAAAGTDVASARAALRTAAWREEAAARRRRHEDRRAQVEGQLADPDLDVPLDPPADAAGAAAALHDADVALEQAVGALAAAERRAADVGNLVPQVEAAQQALEPLQESAALVRRLADLCAGGGANALRMTLSSFVLAARLEQVAEAASGRLLRMTQGRYALVHTDGAARGGARSGLGLLVRDSWTGRDRDTSTLSGGETFQASLALALGLADVVQAEAGGTRIEALFVDEGFGTLDDQSLDEVMDVLDGLREGGRVVALVSHVAELKARIPAQVHVRKGRTGSTLATTGC